MPIYEIRDPDASRRYILQSMWLARAVVPDSESLAVSLDWAREIASEHHPLPLAGFVAAPEPELVSAGDSQESGDRVRLFVPFGQDPILAGPPAAIELSFGAKPQGTPPHIQPNRPSFGRQAQLADQKLRLARQRRHLFWIGLKEQIPNPVKHCPAPCSPPSCA